MRFPKSFTRVVAAGGTTTLGTDTAPTGQPQSILPANNNQLSAALCNVNGFPIQRVVVAYHGPVGAQPLSAVLWCWDDETAAWYQVGDAKLLQPEKLTWFDQPTIGAMGPRGQADQSGQAQMFNPGSLDLCLVVSVSGADPDGTYTFALGMDISNALGDNVAVSATIDKTGLATAALQAPVAGVTKTLADVTIVQNVATPMSGVSVPAPRGVVVQSHPNNSAAAVVRVGGPDTDASHGVILPAGACCFVGVADAAHVYLFSTTAAQVACGMVL